MSEKESGEVTPEGPAVEVSTVKDREGFDRYNFIDEFRGVVVLLLFISAATWVWSGKLDGELGYWTELPLGSTFLNHGWKFFDPSYGPQMITIIDIGSSIFMFVMGMMIPISFRRRREKYGLKAAWTNVFIRAGTFWIYNIVSSVVPDFEMLEERTMRGPGGEALFTYSRLVFNFRDIFLNETLAALAFGTLIGALAAYLSDDPDKRFVAVIAILVSYTICYNIPGLPEWRSEIPALAESAGFLGQFYVPWNLWGFSAVAIAGGCVWDWFSKYDDPATGFRKRILPVAVWTTVACFIVDFYEPGDHHAINTSVALLSIGSASFLFFIFYVMNEKVNYRLPNPVRAIGRNALFFFILVYPIDLISGAVDGPIKSMIGPAPDYEGSQLAGLAAFTVFAVVVLLYMALAVVLDKKRLYLKGRALVWLMLLGVVIVIVAVINTDWGLLQMSYNSIEDVVHPLI